MTDPIFVFKHEWPVIAAAPWFYATCVAVAAIIIWAVVRWFYVRVLVRKDAEITSKVGEIGLLVRERDDLEHRLIVIAARSIS